MPTPTLPTAESRWRCARCGNLTRFDVTRRTRTVEFWHFDLPGEPQVEGPVTDYHLAARDFLTARVLMRRGDVDSAREAFDRAIERASMLPPLNMDDDDTDTPAEARA